jgi:predicted nucleic-acid-binding Zn-ribbon protein
MRKRHVCPKCQHNHILLIESVPDTGEFSTEIRPLHIAQVFVREGWFGDKTRTAGKLSAAVCRRCGYTELYTNDAPLIPVDGTYVREVVGPDPGDQTPYR